MGGAVGCDRVIALIGISAKAIFFFTLSDIYKSKWLFSHFAFNASGPAGSSKNLGWIYKYCLGES